MSTYYSPESITCELEAGGFAVESVLSNLAGEAWKEDSPQIGIICRKNNRLLRTVIIQQARVDACHIRACLFTCYLLHK